MLDYLVPLATCFPRTSKHLTQSVTFVDFSAKGAVILYGQTETVYLLLNPAPQLQIHLKME